MAELTCSRVLEEEEIRSKSIKGPTSAPGVFRLAMALLLLAATFGCASRGRGFVPGGEPTQGGLGEPRNASENSADREPAPQPSLSDEEALAIGLSTDDTIFTASARTVDFNGQALIPRFNFMQATSVYDGNSAADDPADRKLRVYAPMVRAVIGVHEDVTINLTLPYFYKELETTMGGNRVRLNSDGLGDLATVAKWRFFKRPELGGTTEAAAFLGLELPTGEDNARDGGMRLPQPLQPGSGSMDGILGLAFTRLWDGGRWLINADTFYKANSEANDYAFGNVLRFDVGGQLRAYPWRYESFDQFTFNTILELNGSYADMDAIGGERVSTTGGLKLFISPGLQAIVTDSLLLETGIQIPIYRNLNGPQLAEDFRVTVGIRLRI